MRMNTQDTFSAPTQAEDEAFMQLALAEAALAGKAGEVPIGAVVVHQPYDGATRTFTAPARVIARAHNEREARRDPSWHAEFAAMLEAARVQDAWRLTDCTVYVTLEPCLMCAGLMQQARVSRCVYGAPDPKGGALGSLYNINEDERLNHTFAVTPGVLQDECATVLKDFFKEKKTMTETPRVPEHTRIAETDILAEATNAQFRAADFMGPGVLRAVAPAKVNLFLGVGGLQEDGRHSVLNVMHTLALHDTVYANVTPLEASLEGEASAHPARYARVGSADNVLVSVDMVAKGGALSGLSLPEVSAADNLACKAVDALARACSRTQAEHVCIRIEKHVPAQAGLGGGSSDAAAVLASLGHFWDVGRDALVSVAASLGADVPFFLQGGCGLYTGAGEQFIRTLDPQKVPVVLVKPEAGVSTAAAYSAFDENPVPIPDDLRHQVESATEAVQVPLFNNLMPAAEVVTPEVTLAYEWLSFQVPGSCVLLSGSGSALFAETESFADASRIAAAAKLQGYWSRATSFANLKAQVI